MICSGKKNNSSNIDHSVYVYMETYTQKGTQDVFPSQGAKLSS